MTQYHQLADLLLTLEMHMRQSGVWDMPVPSKKDLASQAPFGIDTLGFDQWLRFVMIDKYKNIIEQQGSLPASSNIFPMAEMFFKEQKDVYYQPILDVLQQFDDFITNQNSRSENSFRVVG